MKAAVIHAYGRPPRYEEFPDPEPAEREVLVHVRAAGLHPVVKSRAAGEHYTSHDELPLIPGVDGAGRLEDGSRVYFGVPRSPYGTLAELTVVARDACFHLPQGLDELTVAAVMNPGLSGWLALTLRARLAAGENVLVLGATGVAGRLAVQAARLLGAGRVVAAGRDQQALASLTKLGADATAGIDPQELTREPFDVVLDYLWGRPAEALLEALVRRGLTNGGPRVRFVQVGESAGPTISLSADVLRSSDLEILGSGAGSVPMLQILGAIPEYLQRVGAGDVHVDAEAIPLADVEVAWHRDQRGRRLVFVP